MKNHSWRIFYIIMITAVITVSCSNRDSDNDIVPPAVLSLALIDGNQQISRLDFESTQINSLINPNIIFPISYSYSPVIRALIFNAQVAEGEGLFLISPHLDGAKLLLETHQSAYQELKWSPDGGYFSVTIMSDDENDRIEIYNFESSSMELSSYKSYQNSFGTYWSPGSDYIATYLFLNNDEQPSSIQIIELATDIKKSVPVGKIDTITPQICWSSDETRIFFAEYSHNSFNIAEYQLDKKTFSLATSSEFDARYPRCNPYSNSILYIEINSSVESTLMYLDPSNNKIPLIHLEIPIIDYLWLDEIHILLSAYDLDLDTTHFYIIDIDAIDSQLIGSEKGVFRYIAPIQ